MGNRQGIIFPENFSHALLVRMAVRRAMVAEFPFFFGAAYAPHLRVQVVMCLKKKFCSRKSSNQSCFIV